MQISVIGCGYLGAVHAASMAELGHDVVGIDVDADRVAMLARGELRLIGATRTPKLYELEDVASWIAYGASPRATLGIIAAARALALVRGRDYVVPQDVVEVVPDVLRHRLVLTYDALADEISPEEIIRRVMAAVPLPQVSAMPAPVAAQPR